MFSEIIGAISGNKQARLSSSQMQQYAGFATDIMNKFSGYFSDAYEGGRYQQLLEDPSQITNMPGYQAGMEQVIKGATHGLGATTGLRKGSTYRSVAKAAGEYFQGKWAESLKPYENQLQLLTGGMSAASGYGRVFGGLGEAVSGSTMGLANWKRQTGMMIGGGMDSFAKFFSGGMGGGFGTA